jgi:hypothetical protein
MTMHMDLGLCYRIVFSDSSSLQFRFLGFDKSGEPLIETPPGSHHHQVLSRSDVQDFYQIDVPREELEG